MATQIGAQMYTIRDFCKTPADIAASCAKLSKMGYRAVQASGLGPIEPRELRRILDDHGLVCAATHRGMDQMKDTARIIDEHATLGCKLTALGGFGFGQALSEAEWITFAREYSELARTLHARGLAVGYHNHSHEWATVTMRGHRAVPAIEILLNQCDPAVWFEIDTYWVAHGGADPAQWIEKIAAAGRDRIPAVHLKDITVTPDRRHKMVEVGSGNLNWPRILDACQAAGVAWYLVERDAGDKDPFDSLKISLETLQSWGLR